MDVRLVVDKGNTKQRTWHLYHKDTVIGRRRDCGLRILSAEVSRRHCLLNIDNGYVNVEDLDSINGTFINGRRVVGKQVLRPGDHLEIGPLQFIVEYELSKLAQDRLVQLRAEAAAEDEEVAVLPVAVEDLEANAARVGGEEEELDVLPVVEEDAKSVADKAKKTDSRLAPAAGDEEEPLPAVDVEEGWHLPQTNDLRDLLSQLEESKLRPRRER